MAKKVFVPRYDEIDVINVDQSYEVRVAEYDRAQLTRVMHEATVAYDQRFMALREDPNTQVRWGRTSTNYPDGARGLALLGGFLYTLMRSELNGLSVQDWITGPLNKLANGQEIRSVEFHLPGEVVVNHATWVEMVNRHIDTLGAAVRNRSVDGFTSQVLSCAMLVELFLGVCIIADDGRFSTYVIQTVRNYCRYYLRAFGLTTSEHVTYDKQTRELKVDATEVLSFVTRTTSVQYYYHEVSRFNAWDVLASVDSFLDFVEILEKARLYEEYHVNVLDKYRMLYNVDVVKVFNGFLECPQGFFKGLVDAAVAESLALHEKSVLIREGIDKVRENVSLFLIASWLLPGSGSEALAPRFFEQWAHDGAQVWNGSKESCAKALEFVMKHDGVDSVLKMCDKVMNTYFNDISDTAPYFAAEISVAEIGGIRSLYAFRFNYRPRERFALMRRRVDRGGTRDIAPVSVLTTAGSTGSVVDDVYVREGKRKQLSTCLQGSFYGVDRIPSNRKKAALRAFWTYAVRQTGPERYELEVMKLAKTILPPLSALREYDVYAGNTPRVVSGSIWSLQTVDIEDVDQISAFDMLFLFPRSTRETDDLATLYHTRVKSILEKKGALDVIDYAPAEYKAVMELTPINEQVLSIGGYGVACEFVKTIERAKVFSVDYNSVQDFVSTVYETHRYLKVDFPLHRRAINTRLYEETADGAVIYESADTVGKKPRFVVEKKEFGKGRFKECLAATIWLDLYEDVRFAPHVKVNARNTLLKLGADKKIQLDIRGQVPGSDRVDPSFSESSKLVDKDGNTIREVDLCAPPASAGTDPASVLRWAIRDNAARRLWGLTDDVAYAERANAIADWLVKEYGAGGSDKLSTYTETFDDVILDELRCMTAENLFQKMMGEYAPYESVVPCLIDYDYERVLEDAVCSVTKFRAPATKVTDVVARIPSSVVPNAVEGLNGIISIFANVALENELN